MSATTQLQASLEDFDLRALASQCFSGLRQATADRIGVLRPSYGPGEQKAMELVAQWAGGFGLAASWDAAANLVITLEGREPKLPCVV